MRNIKAFTLIEMLVTVSIVGVLGVIGVSYFKFIPKTQASEALKLMNTKRVALSHLLQNGACTSSGTAEPLKGKYGTLVVLGEFKPSVGQTCPTGCVLTYTFNNSGVSKALAGKTVSADLLNNMKLSKLPSTTVPDNMLSRSFIKLNVQSGDSCTTLGNTVGTLTIGGGTSGTEVGKTVTESPGGLPGTPPAPVTPPSTGGGTTGDGTTTETPPITPPITPPVTPPITPPVTPPVDPNRVVMAFEQPATMRRWSVIDGYYVDAAAYLENSAITFNGVERYLSLINVNKVNTLLVEVFFDFDGVIEVSVPQAWVDTSIYSKVEFDLIMDNGATKHKFVLSKTMIVSYQRPSAVIFRMPDNKFTYFKMMENKINVPVKFSLTFVK